MKRIMSATIFILLFCVATITFSQQKHYEADWKSLDSRPIPQWYDDAKFGIFVHWSLNSVPELTVNGMDADWLWKNMEDPNSAATKAWRKIYGDKMQYQDLAPMFKAELFEPAIWADLFERSGAKYVVLTSKHHDGFCLYQSDYSWNWNSVDVGPHRDLIADLTNAVRAKGLKMGLYYSLYEWFNPWYMNHFDLFVDAHLIPQIKEVITRYKPSVLWTDGEWERTSAQWKSEQILDWLYNESPVRDEIVVNDRWGSETRGKHGGFYTSEFGGKQGWTKLSGMKKWEECRCVARSWWGYSRNDSPDDYRTATELVQMLVEIVSRGGNLLLNVGPTRDGRIPVITQQRLLDLGDWLRVNGEAIYGTHPWRALSDGKNIPDKTSDPSAWVDKYTAIKSVRYTAKGDSVYAISLVWPGKELALSEPKPASDTVVTMLGRKEQLKWRLEGNKMRIEVPQLSIDELPSRHAYVFKITGVK
jgi:alpha-L-fucosidase